MKKLKTLYAIVAGTTMLSLAMPVNAGWVSEEGLPERAYKKIAHIVTELAVDINDDGIPDKKGYKELFLNTGLNYQESKTVKELKDLVKKYIDQDKSGERCRKICNGSQPLLTPRDLEELQKKIQPIIMDISLFIQEKLMEIGPIELMRQQVKYTIDLAVDLNDDGIPEKEGYKILFESLKIKYDSNKSMEELKKQLYNLIDRNIDESFIDPIAMQRLQEISKALESMLSPKDIENFQKKEEEKIFNILKKY